MKPFNATVTVRTRKRKLKSGKITLLRRYFVNYKCPDTGDRKMPSFAIKREAEAKLAEVTAAVSSGVYVEANRVPTVKEAAGHWLYTLGPNLKANTRAGYEWILKNITGPILEGTPEERCHYALTGEKPNREVKLLQMLGDVKVHELTTAEIRRWHRTVQDITGIYSANRALSKLKSILALCEEDFGVRTPAMPTNLARRKSRPKKVILTTEQVVQVITHARNDPDRGIYYVFPFLAGTRPSEQLGLLWNCVDFENNCIHIRRIQERDGTLTRFTKTEAGTREIPMTATLRSMLLAWRLVCPRHDGELHRVFPGPGRLQPWPLPRKDGGGPLLYQNYRRRIWEPVFKRLDLPYVTPHSARHSFISTLQAQGVEVGLVAKLAGHSNANVTLGHYTQAVRGGEEAMRALDRAFSSPVASAAY
jgi:integrase